MKKYKTIQFFVLFILFAGTSLSALAEGRLCVKNKSWTLIDIHFSPEVTNNQYINQFRQGLSVGRSWCFNINNTDLPHAKGGDTRYLKAKIRGLGKKNPHCGSVNQQELIDKNLKVTWKISGTLFGAKCRTHVGPR